MKDFIANNIEPLESRSYGDLYEESATAKVGKLGFKLLSADTIASDRELIPSNLCSMISNANFPLKNGDEIESNDVKVRIQDKNEFQSAIDSVISRGEKDLHENSNLCISLEARKRSYS